MVKSAHKSELYSAYVWLLSAGALLIYSILGVSDFNLPGVENIVAFITKAEGGYIYLAAFLAILIEGTYILGTLFPGSTFVLILALMTQAGGPALFLATILAIFVGWCTAGLINIGIARWYCGTLTYTLKETPYEVKDRTLATWFPAFRANYEVAQIVEGGDPLAVFLSSVRVKAIASICAAGITSIIPFFMDIHDINNQEGFASLIIIALVTLVVGVRKLRRYHKNTSRGIN
jgi:hypothetical protein